MKIDNILAAIFLVFASLCFLVGFVAYTSYRENRELYWEVEKNPSLEWEPGGKEYAEELIEKQFTIAIAGIYGGIIFLIPSIIFLHKGLKSETKVSESKTTQQVEKIQRYCKYCKQEIPFGAVYCPFCGRKQVL